MASRFEIKWPQEMKVDFQASSGDGPVSIQFAGQKPQSPGGIVPHEVVPVIISIKKKTLSSQPGDPSLN